MNLEVFNLWLQNLPGWIILIVILWSCVWKAIALWRSATKKHLVWFIVIFIVNTLGVLEILYIFIFSNLCKRKEKIIKRRKIKQK